MIVDSSALVGIIEEEDEAARHFDALRWAGHVRMSAAAYLESGIVIDGRDPATSHRLDELLDTVGVEVVPFTPTQACIARDADRAYGRGSGHRAHLNSGDWFSYALAVDADEPLLFKDDFGHTDVRQALTA